MDDKIISFFEASKKNNVSYDEFVRNFNLRGEKNLKKLKRSLDRLVSSGTLYFDSKENTYMLFENSNMYKGILLIDNKGRYYISDKGNKLSISDTNLNNALYGDFVLVSFDMKKNCYYVKDILKRDSNRYVSEVVLFNGELCIHDNRFGYLEIANRNRYFIPGSLVLIEKKNNNMADIIEYICHKDDANSDILSIVYNHGFSNDFNSYIKNELESIPTSLSQDVIDYELSHGRVDLRDKDIVTIDCDSTKDIDDGVYVEKNDDGTVSLYVCIANVSHYVKDGSALSVRIKESGTSVYPPSCVIPMLPRELSNGICSLNPNQDRLAMCFKSTFDNNGNVIDFDFFRAVINSKLKMTYSNVDKILENDEMVSGYERFHKQLLMMEKLYLQIENKFYRDGFLEFDSVENEYVLDDKNKIIDIVKSKDGIGSRIIEFFMLITNKNITEYFSDLGINLVYRVDDEPNYNKIGDVIELLQDKKYLDNSIDVYDGDKKKEFYKKKELQRLLMSIKKIPYNDVFSQKLIHTMSKACFSANNIGHYPLGFNYYAQFTSPIRRGGDWRNHTIIDYYLDSSRNVEATNNRFSKEVLEREAIVYSEREKEADVVEAEVKQMMLVDYINNHMEEINSKDLIGRVLEITSSVKISLDNGIKGKINYQSGMCNVIGNDLVMGNEVILSVGDLITTKISGVGKKNGEIFLSLNKNLERNFNNGKKKSEKKVKIREHNPGY